MNFSPIRIEIKENPFEEYGILHAINNLTISPALPGNQTVSISAVCL